MDSENIKVLVCCTGSVAALKIPEIVTRLLQERVEVKVISTDKALHFFDKTTLNVPVLTDADEWNAWQKRGDPVIHIDLRKWADILLIAPLDANTLAKISHGICDNLLTCVIRAWDLKKPLFFAPAMNTYMWEHPLTREQTDKLESWGYKQIPVVEKTLICGDKGAGAMAEVSTIIEVILEERRKMLPAMNTYMWEHPLTREQTDKLESWGYKQIPVVEKTLICGDKGAGAMAEVSTIIEVIL